MIGRPWISRRADGAFDLDLPRSTRAMLASLAPELTSILETGDDPSTWRLFPPASLGDQDVDDEYQLLMGAELLASKVEALELLATTADNDVLTEGDVMAWTGAINSIRLVLGTRLDINDDDDPDDWVEPSNPNRRGYEMYEVLSLILGGLIDALNPDPLQELWDASPDEGNPDGDLRR